MSVLAGQTVLSLLRSRLSDDAASREAFSLKISDIKSKEAILSISGGILRINLINSVRAPNVQIDLGDNNYNTLGKLVKYFNSLPAYEALISDFTDTDFTSMEIEYRGDADTLLDYGLKFYVRIFSDKELLEILDMTAKSHNINYTYQTIPESEVAMILDLAQARALRELATNTIKRSGMEIDSTKLLSQALSYENQYKDTIQRQQRAIPVPSINDDLIGEGNIVPGKIFRKSTRYGMKISRDIATPTERPIMLDFNNQDVGDDFVIVKWKKVFQEHIIYLELWRDTQPNVYRVSEEFSGIRTSQKIFKVSRDYIFSTPLPFDSQLERSAAMYADGITNSGDSDIIPLEPDMEYFYRMFIVDNVGNVVDSNVVSCKTKRPRAKFATQNPVSPVTGPLIGGTLITIKGTNFHQGMSVKIGDKLALDVIVINSTTLTCLSPTMYNIAYKGFPLNCILISNIGLQDILQGKWTYG